MKIEEAIKKYPNGLYPEKAAYSRARYRCAQIEGHFYKYYKGRGIQFKFNSFDEFFANIGPMPNYEEKWQLDRIDNSIGYESNNIRWVTRKENANNRSSNYKIYYEDALYTLQQLCELKQISPSLVRGRLNRGWSIREALEKPPIDPRDKSQNINTNKRGRTCQQKPLHLHRYDPTTND